ncbi:aminotransferase class III-fold pyridoxal phosphate-dependent enzyme [Pantoea vagans]|uniref:aminotransferase class III-fold pyridoxal phosphate-dependent enzyme n=1 Tax=Pantoea vagans TaxID=470934 RepID=UPI003019AEFC
MNNKQLLSEAEAYTAARRYDIDAHPAFIVQSAEGAWLKDCDGNTALDMTSANGTVLFGYCNPVINAAIIEQLSQRGAIFPTPLSPQRITLAERIIARYPAAEKAVFFRTGSDATSAAIRMARAYSGKSLILSSGYHGWHDWQRKFAEPGWDAGCDVFHFGYSLANLALLIEQGKDFIGGVIVTPEPGWYSVQHFNAMYQLCANEGIPFIVDEVMSGLRYGASGFNGAGATADLIVVSKGLANGTALSCIAGERAIIDSYDKAGLAGTYNKEVTPMAAALAALRLIDESDPYPASLATGRELMEELQMAASDAGVPLWVTGAPLMFKTVFSDSVIADYVSAACFKAGLLMECNGTHMINFSFGKREKDYAVAAFKEALKSLKESGLLSARNIDDSALSLQQKENYASLSFGALFNKTLDEEITRALRHRRSR